MSRFLAARNPINGGWIKMLTVGGRITAIQKGTAEGDTWLSPRFIDLQVNGYAGFDVNSDSATTTLNNIR